jgi:hypothetical protein
MALISSLCSISMATTLFSDTEAGMLTTLDAELFWPIALST